MPDRYGRDRRKFPDYHAPVHAHLRQPGGKHPPDTGRKRQVLRKLTGEERFGIGIWGENASGIPYLEDAQASLFCTVAKSMAHGTHTIFVGEVDEVRVGGETAPLLYQEGAFHRAIGLEVTS
jgi:flavin reductase (DIM6/NTAB) family NADH-FMN oxidoreductase RutF